MRDITAAIIKKLKLREAAESEATFWRNLLPPEPWASAVAANPGNFASWVSSRLQSGHRNSAGHVVDARKAHQATRPVPIVGIAERIAYRALTAWVLEGIDLPKRTPADYRAFIMGPISNAAGGREKFLLSEATKEYVVQADISSFYQYVDHGVLLSELEALTGKIEESRLLIELLGEIQGASYGLPQLLEPSDDLSEVYIQVLERDATRRVGRVWRFNDDFRIAVNGYGNAQQVLEDLGAAARPLGLVLNDRKSTILKFSTYVMRHVFAEVEDGDVEVKVDEMELRVDEYSGSADVSGAVASAESLLRRLDEDATRPIELLDPEPDDVRELRHAFGVLTREASPTGLPYVERLFRYLPQLTPRLAGYLIAAGEAGHDALAAWQDVVSRSAVLNSWQRAWLCYVARESGYLRGEPLQWIRQQAVNAQPGLLHAETALALAIAGEGDFYALDSALRSQPEALSPWYALALDVCEITTEQRKAVRGSSRMYGLLLRPDADS